MGVDAAYALTRRRGKPGVITQVLDSSSNPETGLQTDTVKETSVRWMVKEPTSYTRIYRAQATQQDIGDTTFIIWVRDVPMRKLRQEDFITFEDTRFEIVSSVVEETSFVITARETAIR